MSNQYRHFLDDEVVCIPRALIKWRVNIHAHLARAPRDPPPVSLEALTRITSTRPGKHMCHTRMWNFEQRLETLKDIAHTLLQGVSETQVRDMAKAGFFYSGKQNPFHYREKTLLKQCIILMYVSDHTIIMCLELTVK